MDALSSQIYAIQLPPHLLAQPCTSSASFLPEDIHICGNCKQSFTDISYFLQHKNECNSFLSSTTTALLENASSSINLHNLGSEQQLLQIMVNGVKKSLLIQSQPQLNGVKELNSVIEQENNNVLPVASALLECDGLNNSDVRREIQVDEEDVASLLASQFAKEAVYIIPPESSNNNNQSTIIADEIFIEGRGLDTTNEEEIVANVTENVNAIIQEDEPVINITQTIASKTTDILNKVTNNTVNHFQNNNFINSCRNEKDLNVINLQKNNCSIEIIQEPPILSTKRLACCNLCNFVTMYSSDLTRHMRKHTGEKPFVCSVCSQRFPRRDKLHTHMRIHTGEKPYKCQFCDYAAIDSGPLRKHLRTHTDERPFKCQFCPYSAKDTSQLTVHLRTHTGDAPFVCQVEKCKRAFKTSTDLKRHGIVHTRIHPFACKLCDYKASKKLNLQAHYQLSHNAGMVGNGLFKCTAHNCDFKTSKISDFQVHQQNFHPVQNILNGNDHEVNDKNEKKKRLNIRASAASKSHTCNFCNHESRTKNGLKQHVRKIHSNYNNNKNSSGGNNVKTLIRPICHKAYHCTFCNCSFVRQDSYRSHMKQHLNNNNVPDSRISTTDGTKVSNKQVENVTKDLISGASFFIEGINEDEYVSI